MITTQQELKQQVQHMLNEDVNKRYWMTTEDRYIKIHTEDAFFSQLIREIAELTEESYDMCMIIRSENNKPYIKMWLMR